MESRNDQRRRPACSPVARTSCPGTSPCHFVFPDKGPITRTSSIPIAPEHRWLYPIDWRELSRLIRFGRAKGACERCGRPHGAEVIHLGDGRGTWWDAEREHWRDGRGQRGRGLPRPGELGQVQLGLAGLAKPALLPPLPVTRVVLASAHLDHNPGHNRLRNLAALCQRCHMLHDASKHRRTRWRNAFRRRAAADLFGTEH